MRFILVLCSTFDLQLEPMRFILVLRVTFDLQQEPMRYILMLRITSELPPRTNEVYFCVTHHI